MRVISEPETRQLVSVAEAYAVVSEAYAAYGRERVVASDPPLALMIVPHTVPSLCSVKGSCIPSRRLFGVRMGMQMANYYEAVHDTATGRLLGLVDETWLTRRRVGCTAAVTAAHVARPRSNIVAMIGAGHLMEEVYLCMQHPFPGAHFRVASRRFTSAQAFAARLGTPERAPLDAVPSVAEAVKDADIVVTVTVADRPMVLPGMLKRGAALISMGGAPEVDFGVLSEIDRLVVDEFDYASLRGDFAEWINAGHISAEDLRRKVNADIGEIVTGAKSGRETDDERVMAVIQGMAVCDLAMAAFCIEKGAGLNVGTYVESIARSEGRKVPEGNPEAARIAEGLKKSRQRLKT